MRKPSGSFIALAVIAAFWLFTACIGLRYRQHVPPKVSQDYTWRVSQIPVSEDQREYCVTVGSSGSLFVGTLNNGVLRSLDGGRTWHRSSTGMQDCFVNALAVSNKGTILAGTGRGVYRSTDGGSSWVIANKGLPTASVCGFAMASTGRIYAAADGGRMFHSEDDGCRWKSDGRLPRNGDGDALLVTRSKSVLCGVSFVGVYRCQDGEHRWTSVTPGFIRLNQRPDYEHATSDDDFAEFNSAAMDGRGRVYMSANVISDLSGGGEGKIESCILRSDDDGRTWTRLFPAGKGIRCNSVAVDAKGRVFAGTARGLYISADRGDHWQYADVTADSFWAEAFSGDSSIARIAPLPGGGVFALRRDGKVYVGAPRR
jgi:photosystem II stability/assembly factor-like uncharacterized protein